MKITKYDPLKRKEVTMELPITEEQYNRWQAGEFIQIAMPNLTPIQREFLITGISDDDDWNELFSDDDEEEDDGVE